MNVLSFVLLLGNTQGEQSNPLMSFLPLVLIIGVFYFFMIRPQMKKQKEMKKFREDLKNGDKVVTSGGIYGKILEVRENVVILEVEDKMRLKVDKAVLVRDSADLEQGKK